MKHFLSLVSLGLMGLSGCVAQAPSLTESDEIMSMDMEEHEMDHTHERIEWDESLPVPTVELIAQEDVKGGWNLEVVTTHFTFTPELANEGPVMGEGHAHLYLNGEKVTRLYGPWFYYNPALEPGTYELSVDLNANDHSLFTIEGEPIGDSVTLVVD